MNLSCDANAGIDFARHLGLRLEGIPTLCGVPSPSPQPSPNGRGGIYVRAFVQLNALDVRAGGRRFSLSQREKEGVREKRTNSPVLEHIIGSVLFGQTVLCLSLLLLAGCASAPPPPPVPPARRQAQFQAETAAKLSQIQNWTAANREWQQVADQFAALNDRTNEAIALHNLAQARRELGQVEAAHTLLEQAARLNQESGRTNEWWRNQIVLLQIEVAEKRAEDLRQRFESLTPFVSTISGTDLGGLFFNELGQWQQQQGQFSAATNSFNQAEQVFLKTGWREGSAAVQVNRAQLFLAQTNCAAAQQEWRRALTSYEALAEPSGIAHCLAGIGRTLLVAKSYKEAEKYLRQAARNYRTLKKPAAQIETLQLLVECLKSQDLPVASVLEELARARESYALVLETAGNLAAARDQWQASASLWDSLHNPTSRDQAKAAAQRCAR